MSWLGLLVHNFLESVDGSTIAVGLVSAGLFLGWWRIPSRRSAMAWLLLGMGIAQFVGATVAVVPFGFLPFIPSDRKSTRLNSSHTVISYAVFCLKKKI